MDVTERDGERLDADAVETLAAAVMAGRQVDLGAVRARAARGSRRRPGTGRWVAVAAAAAAVVLAVLTGVTGLVDRPVEPARTPPGPGALPERLVQPPAVPLLVTEHPIARVAVLARADLRVPAGRTVAEGTMPLLVSADGGEYRRLPATFVDRVVVSADGRVVAWVDQDPSAAILSERPLRWVDVSTGRVRTATFEPGARETVRDVVLAPDGSRAVVVVTRLLPPEYSGGTATVWDVDLRTGETRRRCGACLLATAGFSPDGRLWTQPVDEGGRAAADAVLPVLPSDVLPDGQVLSGWGDSLWVEDDGSRAVVTGSTPNIVGTPEDFGVALVGPDGTVEHSVALGRLTGVQQLARDADTVWLGLWSGESAPRTVRVDLATGAVTDVLPGEGGAARLYVTQLVRDVAAGGRTAPMAEPEGEPWWALDRLRVLLPLLAQVLLGAALAVVLLVVGVRRVRR